MENKLKDLLLKAKKAYYEGNPIMDDRHFDNLEDQLRSLNSDSDYFKLIGIPDNYGKKIIHKFPMRSLQKAKNIDELKKWIDKLKLNDNEELIVMPKIDGLSGSLYYENGKLKNVTTRGNGVEGSDITHVSLYISDIPLEIENKNSIYIRGEFYLPKNNGFAKEKLRNVCAGLIGRKENLEDLINVRFITYSVENENYDKFNLDVNLLQRLNFSSVIYRIFKVYELEEVIDNFSIVKEFNYETDGLVICMNDKSKWNEINSNWKVDHHNHYNIALKSESEKDTTVLRSIEWQVSRNGCQIPVAIFDPIILLDREVKRASLSNYKNVINMKLEIGDELLVSLSNDVIPYVEENISKGIKQR